MSKAIQLNDDLLAYIDRHRFDHGDPILIELIAETQAKFGKWAMMQIAPDQGALFNLLVGSLQPSLAVEIGTFTGYSSICTARGLPPGGELHCFDISEPYTAVARDYWAKAGLADRITLHLGDVVTNLSDLPDRPVGFAFIDADKTGYDAYYEALLPRMAKDGLIVFDNMMRGGKITAPPAGDEDTAALDALNKKLIADKRVQAALVPLADGLTMCRVV